MLKPGEIAYSSESQREWLFPYRIGSVGHSRFLPDTPTVRARYDDHAFILTLGGRGRISQLGADRPAEPGALHWVNTGQTYAHRCDSDAPHWEYLWFSARGFQLDALFDRVWRGYGGSIRADADVVARIRAIHDLVLRPQPDHGAGLSAALAGLLTKFVADRSVPPTAARIDGLMDRVRETLEARWTNDRLADAVDLSLSQFHETFRRAVGMSPASWLRAERMDLAKRLLISTKDSIAEIGRRCGYPDPQHFSREFSKSIGTAASRFRTELRQRLGN